LKLAVFLLVLALAAVWVWLPGLRPGWQKSGADLLQAAAERARKVWLEAGFYLPLPAYWRLEWPAVPQLGLPGVSRSGLGWGKMRLRLELEARPHRRGEHALPPARLFVGDVFGLRWRELPLAGETPKLTVYPRIWQQLPPDLALTLLAEGPESNRLGLEDASRYRGVRPYQPGDPLRRLHWKATAHLGRPMVREFSWVRATGVWIFVDTQGSDVYVDHMAELAASLAVHLERQGLAVGLTHPTGELPPARGLAAMQRMMAELAKLRPSETSSPPPLPPAGVNLLVMTEKAPLEVIEGALAARARASRVYILAFPEGFFLRPGESGRPVWGRTPGMLRLLERRRLLESAGVHVHVFRGNQHVVFPGGQR